MKHSFLRALAAMLLPVLVLAGAWQGSAHAQQPPAGEATAQETLVQANLEGVFLADFIRFIGQYTGRNIVFRDDQIPKVKINIVSQESMSDAALLAIFHETLASAGLTAVSRDGSLLVQPAAQSQRVVPALRSKAGPGTQGGQEDEMVLTACRLKEHMHTKTAGESLKNLMSASGQIVEIPQARTLLLIDTRDRVDRVLRVLDLLQSLKPSLQFAIFPLHKADAARVSASLQELFEKMLEEEQTDSRPLLTALVWSNSVLMAGTAEQKATVAKLLADMDRVDTESQGLINIYRLRNAKAESVSSVLEKLVGQSLEKKEQAEGAATSGSGGKALSKLQLFQVSADEETNSVVVLSSKEVQPAVEKIIQELDRPMDQVYVEALIMETTLTNAKEFGVEWLLAGKGKGDSSFGNVGFVRSSSSLLSYAEPVIGQETAGVPQFESLPAGFSLGVLGNIITFGGEKFANIGALVNFAKDVSKINILSTPQLMTLDHAEAEVFVGQEVPYATSEKFDANNNPVNTFEYRDVGIKLKVTPHINKEENLIRLDLEQELKQVIAVSEQLAPTTLNRYTKTSVQLMDGATIVISGLISNDTDKSRQGIPGLAAIPAVGWLFKRETTSSTKTTILVFISARIIHTVETARAITKAKQEAHEALINESESLYEDAFSLRSGRGSAPAASNATGVQ
ncbi:type II secretion system secretin GspD [Megalodesulfovibrio gigas]|uniref:General secretion pathway protein D n=1 Tax=Megalodesulfovibrio gigas (strain ATCC 19364 / DSM 1382 / NCIMB 9332 / VKM B-1759) TaxID=1121448 RepID=T2GGI0_MEGG1|nr:type II secretion system secretin GspD [Megalodesulfovibrio gigas]AGW15217.1 general secretion pathway protein D [Megalodesulfovibrio gigas DSM 1382 = ATCC 19364]